MARRTPPPDLPLAAKRPRRACGRGSATLGRLALLGLAALLSGTPLSAQSLAASAPRTGTAAAIAPAPQPGPATNALNDPALLALEAAVRAHPMRTAVELGRYAQRLPDNDARRWFALGLQATVLAAHNELDEAERCVQLAMKLQSGQLDDAVRLRQQATTLADRLGPDWRAAEARNNLAYALVQAEQIERATEQQTESMALARRSGDAVALSRALTTESFLRSQANDRSGERAALEGAIAAARQAGAREIEVLGMANLADHYLLRGDYITALSLAQQALPLAQDLADLSAEAVALSNIGLAL
ncbi:MAG: hypothetical protein CFE45_09650, partial [Burkholderiales bacterium PBB5]